MCNKIVKSTLALSKCFFSPFFIPLKCCTFVKLSLLLWLPFKSCTSSLQVSHVQTTQENYIPLTLSIEIKEGIETWWEGELSEIFRSERWWKKFQVSQTVDLKFLSAFFTSIYPPLNIRGSMSCRGINEEMIFFIYFYLNKPFAMF